MAYQTLEQRKFSENRDDITISHKAAGKESTSFEGKYKTIEYPSGELGSERYPHFAIFYINENSRSVLEKGNFTTTSEQIDPADRSSNVAMSKSTPILSSFAASKKRLNYAICLPMPQKLSANYNAKYIETEAVGVLGSVVGALGQSGQQVGSQPLSALNALIQTGLPALFGPGGIGTQLANKLGAGGLMTPDRAKAAEQQIQKAAGAVTNNRQEQLFQSMEFRAHHLQWLFLPRSFAESEYIFQICQTFKEHMHPEEAEGTGSSVLLMPAEFDIEFRYGSNENVNIGKIATCVLKSATIDYTPVGEFITFEGYSHPIAIVLNLTFAELEPLTRRMIKKGF